MNAKKESKLVQFMNSSSFKSYSGVIVITLLLGAALAVFTPNHAFLSTNNILNVLRQVAVYGMLSVGMAFVMIGDGIDLSVGSVAGLTGVLACTWITQETMGIVPSIIVAVALATVIGLCIGLIVAITGIPPFVATLAAQISVRGFAYIACDGKPVGNLPDMMEFLGVGRILGVPIPIIVMAVLMIAGGVILAKTSYGRSVYAVGGNATASRLAGVNVKRVKITNYTISGFMAGVAGIMLACRNASAQPTGGNAFETEAIAGCAMGGVAFTGGSGSMVGVFFGVFLMGIINNGMNLLGINSYWQLVVKGAIIVVAVVYSMRADSFGGKKKGKEKK